MINIKDLPLNYITNEVGEKTAVIISIAQFEELLEDIEDLVIVAERRDEPTTSHADLLSELKQDELI
jgi:predicted lipid carrier protein YhbT